MQTSDVRAAIRNYYPPAEYAVLWEVSNGTGSRARRFADAVVMSLWPSRGLSITGIEIKVSRSDWLREIKAPEKAEVIARYCDYWNVFVPEGVVQMHEVPMPWGVYVVSEKGAIKCAKAPSRNDNPKALDRDFVAAMLRRASDADSAEISALVEQKLSREKAVMQDTIEKEVARRLSKYTKLEASIAKFREAGIDLVHGWEDPATIARYIKLGKQVQQHQLGVENVKKTLTGMLDLFNQLDEALPQKGE